MICKLSTLFVLQPLYHHKKIAVYFIQPKEINFHDLQIRVLLVLQVDIQCQSNKNNYRHRSFVI
jgi:hypothetical protein